MSPEGPTFLSGVDAAWLRMDDPTNLMMVTGVLTFSEPLDMDRLADVLESRLLILPRFRERVVEAPLRVISPRWVADERFNLSAHLHRVGLPSPGGDAGLRDLVSDLMSTPLDRTKPLWHMHVVEGYKGGSALVVRIHHCIADGIALVQLMLSLTDSTRRGSHRHQPPAREATPPLQRLRADAERAFRAGRSLVGEPGRWADLLNVAGESASSLVNLIGLPPDSPSILKGELGVAKLAAWSPPVSLDRVKEIGSRFGATVNDVLLTAATGSLRRYLLGREERVPTSYNLRAAVPVNLRAGADASQLGNRFGLVFLSLPVGIAQPGPRLRELKRRMEAIKSSMDAPVSLAVLDRIGMLPAEVQSPAVRFFGSKATVVMTNVPGPREPLYLAQSRIDTVMYWVPQAGRLGLGLSILSYAGRVMVGVASDAGLVPDPTKITAGFEEELDSLGRARAGRAVAAPA